MDVVQEVNIILIAKRREKRPTAGVDILKFC